MSRTAFAFGLTAVLAATPAGCIKDAVNAVNPPAEGGGTLSCREVVETCDKECTQIMCLHACTNNGTAEAAAQHDALLSCGEKNGCTDEDCITANCRPEVDTCMGPETTAPAGGPDGPATSPGEPAPATPPVPLDTAPSPTN